MRCLLLLSAFALAACGQTGALYLPDQGIETPVEVRGPTPSAAPAEPEEEKDEEREAPPAP